MQSSLTRGQPGYVGARPFGDGRIGYAVRPLDYRQLSHPWRGPDIPDPEPSDPSTLDALLSGAPGLRAYEPSMDVGTYGGGLSPWSDGSGTAMLVLGFQADMGGIGAIGHPGAVGLPWRDGIDGIAREGWGMLRHDFLGVWHNDVDTDAAPSEGDLLYYDGSEWTLVVNETPNSSEYQLVDTTDGDGNHTLSWAETYSLTVEDETPTVVTAVDEIEFLDTDTATVTVTDAGGGKAQVEVDVDVDGGGDVTDIINNFWSNTFGEAVVTELRFHYKQDANGNVKKLVMPVDGTIDWRYRHFVAWLTIYPNYDSANGDPDHFVPDVWSLPGYLNGHLGRDGYTGSGNAFADLFDFDPPAQGGWVMRASPGASFEVTFWVSDGTAEKGESGGGTDWLGSDPEKGNLALMIEDGLGGASERSMLLTIMVGAPTATEDGGTVTPETFVEIGDGH